ncbi:MAG: sulfatase-like hydrolase/transferase [Opitutales bacterium]
MRLAPVLFGLLACLAALLSAAERRPNVVLILVDDFGYECVTADGGQSYQTPVLDRMSREGVRFARCHVQPLCTPTRAALMTGVDNFRNYTRFGNLDPSQRTFANLFRGAGYATAVVGKWQLEGGADGVRAFGFDEHCLWQLDRRPSRYRNPGLEVNGRHVDYVKGEYGPDMLSDYAVDFIGRMKNRPFMLYYPMVLTHDPFEPTPVSPGYGGAGGDKQANFRDMVAYADRVIGKVLAALDAAGVRDDTLVMVVGDNGTGRPIVSKFEGRDYPGGKGGRTVSGSQVPLLVQWPGRAVAGRVSEGLVSAVDFLPTLAEACGIEQTGGPSVDGVSFLGEVTGKGRTPRTAIHSWYSREGGTRPSHQSVLDGRHKLYADGSFYDVVTDPEERSPIAASAQTETQARARTALAAELAKFSGDRPAWTLAKAGPGAAGSARPGKKKAR